MKRREFLRLSALTAGATLIPVKTLAASEEERLDPSDPQAQALQYTHDSTVEGQRCDNCIHANGDLSADWIGCNLFPGRLVNAGGWCSVWTAR